MAVKNNYPLYDNEKMCEIIDRYVHSERDREILKRRLADGIHFEPLAEEVKLSTGQVKNILRKYEKMIFDLYDRNFS